MPKPTVRMLPDFGHSYGLPGARDAEGVKSCKYLIHMIFSIFVQDFKFFSEFNMQIKKNSHKNNDFGSLLNLIYSF